MTIKIDSGTKNSGFEGLALVKLRMGGCAENKGKYLNLSHCMLRSQQLSLVGVYSSLITLDLSYNELHVIGEELLDLVKTAK